jgi:hypothetical protein
MKENKEKIQSCIMSITRGNCGGYEMLKAANNIGKISLKAVP